MNPTSTPEPEYGEQTQTPVPEYDDGDSTETD